jgi:hypothetical protein
MAESKSSSPGGVTSREATSGVGRVPTTPYAGETTPRSSSITPGANAPSSRDAMQSSSGSDRAGVVDTIKDRAAAQINSQKDRATDGLGTMAQAVRQSTQQLREQHHETVASYVEQAADHIERLSQRLRQKDIGTLLADAQHLARRQPALFVGSAFALGVIVARFLKSSPPIEQRYGGYGAYGAGAASGSPSAGRYRESLSGASRHDYERETPSVSLPTPSSSGTPTQRDPTSPAYRSTTEDR